jgi:hypothetical protein
MSLIQVSSASVVIDDLKKMARQRGAGRAESFD